MGDVYNFLDYKEAKMRGITVEALRKERQIMSEMITKELLDDIDDEYALYSEAPDGYPYIMLEDMDTGYHDYCRHKEWAIVEEGYQATCKKCSLNAWSAPW